MNKYTFLPEPIIYRLLRSEVSALSGDIERQQRQFAANVGGRTLNEYGVNLAWQQVTVDIIHAPGATPLIAGILSSMFADSMAAVIEDDAFLADVLKVRRDVLKVTSGNPAGTVSE